MPAIFSIQPTRCLVLLGLASLGACAITLPPPPPNGPASPGSAESATAPLRPSLLASSRNFLSPSADDREERVKKMDRSKMAAGSAYFTCQMHPQIHEEKPGQCPICGMTLVKKIAAGEGEKQ